MKNLFIMLTILPTVVFASLNSTCEEYTKSRIDTFKITKSINEGNVLHFSVAIDEASCGVKKTSNVVSPYWIMGHKKNRGKGTSCEEMTKKEVSRFLGYNSKSEANQKMAKIIDSQTIELKIPNLAGLGDKMGDNTTFSDIVTIKLSKTAQGCRSDVSGVRNSRDINFDQIDFKLSMFSLKKVSILKNGSEI